QEDSRQRGNRPDLPPKPESKAARKASPPRTKSCPASSCIAPSEAGFRGRRARPRSPTFYLLVPRKKPRSPDHNADAGRAHQDLGHDAVRHLGEQEMPGKRQQYAEAENLKRMLPAGDRRPEYGRLQRRPVAWHERHRDHRERDKVQDSQNVEIG